MNFKVTLDRDEDGIWIVECPAIPGCVSQGMTREEAVGNIRDAIQMCLEVRAEQGLPPTVETREVEVASDANASGSERARSGEGAGFNGLDSYPAAGQPYHLTKPGEPATLSVPDHKEVARGTLRSLLRSANLTTNEFVAHV